MKLLILVVLALVALIAADHEHDHHHHAGHDYVVKTSEDLAKFRDHCSTKLHVPAEKLEKYKQWQYPDDEMTHCYMKCMFEEFGIFDETHGFNVHKIHHQLAGDNVQVNHDDETHAKIELCADKNTQGSDACQWAYRGGMCFIREHLHLVKKSVETH